MTVRGSTLSLALLVVLTMQSVAAAAPMGPRRLDGVSDFSSATNIWPVAVMIDNHNAARPQAGLQDAAVVYEALAEGGIPRFMAIFAHYGTPLLGPVRSARPYFLRYAVEYPAGLVHAGGSPDAQELLKKYKLYNIEGVKGPTAKNFFRIGKGTSTLFIRGKSIKELMKKPSYTRSKPTYKAWRYIQDPALAKRATGKHGATIDLGGGKSYAIEYTYDRKSNTYLRKTGGKVHIDRNTGKQIRVKNLVLLLVPKERVLDKKGRLELQTVGSGKAILHKDGRAITINWSKKTERARLILTDSNKREVGLNQGNTWLTVVPKGRPYRVY